MIEIINDEPTETIGGAKGAKSLEELAGRGAAIGGLSPTSATPNPTDQDRMREIAELRKPMEKFSAMQELFNHHPKVQEAMANADRYGMSKEAALHQALDQHSDLRQQFARLHEYFEKHVQPAMEKHMELAKQMHDPQLQRDAEGSLHARIQGMHRASAHWPDKEKVLSQDAGPAKQRQPGLGDVLANFLNRLYEKLFGKPATASAETQNAAKANPEKPASGMKDTAKTGMEAAAAVADPAGYAVTKGVEYVAKQVTTPNRPKGPR